MIRFHDFVMVRIGDLTGAEYNPRTMSVEEMDRLVSSIRTYGFVEPVVVRAEDNLLVGGHQRVAALRQIEQSPEIEVPAVRVKGLDDRATKALNLALNKIGGDWDYAKLTPLLEELTVDLDTGEAPPVTGFSDEEIAEILDLVDFGAPDDDEESIEDGLAASERRFSFKIAREADAEIVRDVLRQCGWTGPSDAAESFVRAMRLASERLSTRNGPRPRTRRGKA